MDRKSPWLCPECGSDDIYHTAGSQQKHAKGGIANMMHVTFGLVGESVPLDVYVCGSCGAVRTFISGEEALAKVRKNWDRLNG